MSKEGRSWVQRENLVVHFHKSWDVSTEYLKCKPTNDIEHVHLFGKVFEPRVPELCLQCHLIIASRDGNAWLSGISAETNSASMVVHTASIHNFPCKTMPIDTFSTSIVVYWRTPLEHGGFPVATCQQTQGACKDRCSSICPWSLQAAETITGLVGKLKPRCWLSAKKLRLTKQDPGENPRETKETGPGPWLHSNPVGDFVQQHYYIIVWYLAIKSFW